jgi:hypothetical protein
MPDANLKENFKIFKEQKIYFAHQSVGENILKGIYDLGNEIGESDINIINLDKIDNLDSLPSSYLLHSKIGENEHPGLKCEDYASKFKGPLAGKVKYALLKFCYIDINQNTNVDSIFSVYKETIDTLKTQNPDIVFVHLTVPLRLFSESFTMKIREFLGQSNRHKLDNIKRNAFNDLLLKTYAADPIFDLAKVESTFPDGSRFSFQHEGKPIYGLVDDYTNDGGHLNALGQRVIGQALINYIADLSKTQ